MIACVNSVVYSATRVVCVAWVLVISCLGLWFIGYLGRLVFVFDLWLGFVCFVALWINGYLVVWFGVGLLLIWWVWHVVVLRLLMVVCCLHLFGIVFPVNSVVVSFI